MAAKRSYTKSAARQQVTKAIKRGLIAKPEGCQKCGSPQDRYLMRYWVDLHQPLDVVFMCKKCYVSICPQPKRRQRPLENPSYFEIKRLMCDFGWTYAKIGKRYGKTEGAIWHALRSRAIQRGEWEEVKARIAQHNPKRTLEGRKNGTEFVPSGVGIYGTINDWLRETKAFEVSPAGVAVELSRTRKIQMLATRAETSYSRLHKCLGEPDHMILRKRAVRLLLAIGEPLPEDWPESRSRKVIRAERKDKDNAVKRAKYAASRTSVEYNESVAV